MLSILIPTYDYNAYPLVCELEKQAIKTNCIYEIICFDDGSKSSINIENKNINNLKNSKFIELRENIGLSNIRNTLAEASTYENLLFIDGDSIVSSNNYIQNYLKVLNENYDVIYGGRIHPKKVEPNRKLRWKYGIYKEDSNVLKRIKNKYISVIFNNTIIRKSVFNKIYFNKEITQYGHEDTVFAYELSKMNASVLHIENSVLHGDVDLNTVFYNKTKKAINNLNLIYKNKLIEPEFVKFLKLFTKLKRIKLNYLISLTYKMFHPIFTLNLTSKNPSIYVFEWFRLSYFCYINLKK